jgi:hypothetical protein
MKLIQTALLVAFAVIMAVPFGMGKFEYTKKTGRDCDYCHPHGRISELTAAGRYYKEHKHSLEGYKEPAPK